MTKRIKGITIELDGSTTGLEKALESVNKRSKDIQGELQDVNRLLRFNPDNVEVLAQKQKLLADQVENTRDKLNQLKDAEAEVQRQFEEGKIAEEQYRAFQREIIETESKLRHFEGQLDSTKSKWDELAERAEKAGERFKNAGESMTNVGKDLSLKVTAPIVGIGTLATKAAIDFESAFAGVRKTVDATEEEFQELEKGIREMSKELPASASDIAEVAEAAGQLGIEKENILDFTRTMIDLGEATNMTADEAATALAQFANVVQMPQENFDRLGSSIVALGNNMATTEKDIVNMAMRLSGTGAQIGLTESDIMALSASMASVGINAEAGGSAMSTVMKKIQNAVSDGGDDLQGFAQAAGMTASEFADAFNGDPITAIDSFIKGLAASGESGENLNAILGDLGIKGIQESDTLLRLAGASEILGEAVETASQAWEENSALSEEAKQRYETTAAQLAMLKNTLVDFGITIGDVIIPVILDLVEKIKPWLERLNEIDESTLKVIMVIAGLAAAIGPLLIVIGQMAMGIGAILKIIPTLITSVGLLGKALMFLAANPVGLIITAIAALIAIGVALWKNWDTIAEKATSIGQWIKDKWNGIVEFFKGINLADIGRDIIQGLINGIQDKFNALKDKMRDIGDSIKDTIANVLGIRSPSTVMIGFGENIGEGMAIGIERASSMVKEMSQRMANMAIPDVRGVAGQAITNSTTNNQVSNVFHVTVQADDLRQVSNVLDLFDQLRQVSRQGV